MAFKFLDVQGILEVLQQQEATAGQRFRHLCDQLHDVLRRLPEPEPSDDSPADRIAASSAVAAETTPAAVPTPVVPLVMPAVEPAPVPPPAVERAVPEPPPARGRQSATAQWESIVLGPELAGNPKLAAGCRALVAGLAEGDPRAMTLVGQLLLFRSAAVQRYPQLLNDLGEAYYGWRKAFRDDDGRFGDVLVDWLSETCAAGGLANSIELVQPGDRFDPTRHQASQTGVEVAEVCGWVVLRDNGKVYTRAAVTVR